MNTSTVSRDKATIERQTKATSAFIEKAHRIWHERMGVDANCHRCGNCPKSAKGFNI